MKSSYVENLASFPLAIYVEGIGGVPEWPKGPDCKSDGSAFVGSNPTPSTRSRKLIRDGLAEAEVHKFAGMV